MSNSTRITPKTNKTLGYLHSAYLDEMLELVLKKHFQESLNVSIMSGVPISRSCMYADDIAGSPVPAAGFVREKGLILVHPYLLKKRNPAPRYVVNYLIYHECLHYLYPEKPGQNPHHELFMEHERQAPNRYDAIQWLTKNNFPTLPL